MNHFGIIERQNSRILDKESIFQHRDKVSSKQIKQQNLVFSNFGIFIESNQQQQDGKSLGKMLQDPGTNG